MTELITDCWSSRSCESSAGHSYSNRPFASRPLAESKVVFPFANGWPILPFGDGKEESPFSNGWPILPFGDGKEESPFGNGWPILPFGDGKEKSPFAIGQPFLPFGDGRPFFPPSDEVLAGRRGRTGECLPLLMTRRRNTDMRSMGSSGNQRCRTVHMCIMTNRLSELKYISDSMTRTGTI